MSHSKKRGQSKSLYLDSWNPAAKKYLVACGVCGKKGYKPTVAEFKTSESRRERMIFKELDRLFDLLDLSKAGICRECCKQVSDASQ